MSAEQVSEPENITDPNACERPVDVEKILPNMRSLLALDFPPSWQHNQPEIPADVDDN